MKIGLVLYDYYPFGGFQEGCLATAVETAKRGHGGRYSPALEKVIAPKLSNLKSQLSNL